MKCDFSMKSLMTEVCCYLVFCWIKKISLCSGTCAQTHTRTHTLENTMPN